MPTWITHRTTLSLAFIAIVALAAFAGHPILDVDQLAAGLPMVMVGDMAEIKTLLDKQGQAFEEFKSANDKRLKAVEEKGYAPSDVVETVEKLNAELTRIGIEIKSEQARLDEIEKKSNRLGATGSSLTAEQEEHKTAFLRFARKGDDAGLREAERKAMTVGSDPDGGYFVPPTVEAALDSVLRKNSALMGLARNVTVGSATYKKRVRTSGAAYGWVGESDAPSETGTPGYSMLEFPVGKIYAEPQISQDLLEDAEIDIEAELRSELEMDLAEGIGAALITGNGVNKPRGLFSYTAVANASYAWGKVGYIASGGAGAFAASNPSDALIDLVHALKAGYRNGSGWIMNDLTLAAIRKFKDSTGQYLWQPSLQAGVPSLLAGYPVATDDNVADIAANSLSIAFGNFQRAYVVVNRRGIAVLRDPYTAKPFVKFYTTKRIGGGIQNYEAVKYMKFAAS